MPLKFQKNIFIAGLIFSSLSLLLLVVAGYLLWVYGINTDYIRFDSAYPGWYIFRVPENPGELLINVLICISAVILFSFFANTSLWNLFRKTVSPEIFFTMIFIFSLSLEVLRMGMVLAQAWALPVYLSIALTRGVYLGRFLALLCLLAASLYGIGMKYSNYSTLLAGLLLLSVTMASIIPVDSTTLRFNFLHKLGDEQGYILVNIITGFLVLLNYTVARITRRSNRFFLVAAAALLLFIGKELVYFGISPVAIGSGLLILVLGTVLFSRQIGVFYLGL